MTSHRIKALTVLPLQLVMGCLFWLGNLGEIQAEVTINGVEASLQENILAYLRLDDEACDTPEWRVRRLFADSEDEIRKALEVVGFYTADISKSLSFGETCWQASFTVTPGKPVILRNVSITIENGEIQNVELEKVIQGCSLTPGDVLNHATYESCRRSLSHAAEKRGYFSAKFLERRIDVYPEQYIADITLHFIPGKRYVFGAVTFQQDVLDPELVNQFTRITPGEPYDAALVRRIQRDLITSAYFDQVLLTRKPRGEPYYDVPIHIKLTPGNKYQYSAGIGFATDVGPKLRFGFLNRRINTKGHQFEFEANLSRVISGTGITYRIPMKKPKDWVTLDSFYKIEDNDSFESKLFSAGVQRVQETRNDWLRTLFLNLRLEDYETGSLEDGYSKLLTPGVSYAFIQEDFPPRPLKGHRTTVQTRGAIEGVISDTSFLQLYGNTKWVFKLWSSGRLLTRAEAGATMIDEFDTLPASVRFFAGGDVSVRGYGYKTLGPTDEFGAVVGGENLLVGSLEIDQKISDNWSLAAFIDSGNAYDQLSEFNPATGVGAGIRWFSPLGPIRFDVAIPLENDAPDDYRIHITLGPDL